MNKVKEPTFWLLFVLPIIIGSVAVVWLFKPPNRDYVSMEGSLSNIVRDATTKSLTWTSSVHSAIKTNNMVLFQSSTNVIRLKSISLDNLRDWLHGKTNNLDDYQMEFCNQFGPVIKQLIEEERR